MEKLNKVYFINKTKIVKVITFTIFVVKFAVTKEPLEKITSALVKSKKKIQNHSWQFGLQCKN